MENCPVVFPVDNIHGSIATHAKRNDEYTMVPVFLDTNLTSFMVLEESNPGEVVVLPPVCLQALEWPYQTLAQTRRADVIVALFQTCLVILSTIAIFCQSIPHIISALSMHFLAFIWSSSQVAATVTFRSDYRRLITSAEGACNGMDFLVDYFKNRLGYEIAMTVINLVTLLVSAFLTWRLFLIYGWTTFKESNSSPIIQRAHIVALALSAIIQLAAFFQITSIALWLEEITRHIMGATSKGEIAYLVLYILLALSLVPWFYFAWRGIREESKKLMMGFFGFTVLYLAGFAGLLVSDTFRQSLMYWSFFTAMFAIALILILTTATLAIMSQLNFGIGLHRHLDPSGTGGFRNSSADIENVSTDFPVTFPDEKPLQREGSVSSNSSTLRSEHSFGYSKAVLMAAQPGSIKILPPVPAASAESDSPRSKGTSTPLTPLRKYGKEFWGRSRRHESAMSFGHMDASKLDRGVSAIPGTIKAPLQLTHNVGRPLTLDANSFAKDEQMLKAPPRVMAQPALRVDSMGSIYSTNSTKPRLVLVTAL